jgi:hypothetical protein
VPRWWRIVRHCNRSPLQPSVYLGGGFTAITKPTADGSFIPSDYSSEAPLRPAQQGQAFTAAGWSQRITSCQFSHTGPGTISASTKPSMIPCLTCFARLTSHCWP